MQLTFEDFDGRKYICLINGSVWESRMNHESNCVYTYCKKNWMFSHDSLYWNKHSQEKGRVIS